MTEENKQDLNPCLRMYDFFSHMSDYHGLTLTDTEMHDIISVCAKYADSKPEVEDMKHQLLDSEWKNGLLETKVERLRTALSNADEEIIVLSDQRNDAMAYVTSLKAEAERLKAESKANYRLLKSAVAKRTADCKERDEYKQLLGVANSALRSANKSQHGLFDDVLAETGGN